MTQDHHQRNNATIYAAYAQLGIGPDEAEARWQWLTGQRRDKPVSMGGKIRGNPLPTPPAQS